MKQSINKIYIVVDACSGEDYSADDPTILFVSDNYEKAKSFFNYVISTYEDDLEDFDSNCEKFSGETKMIYECTDFENDSHRIMKLVKKEIQ